MYNKYVLTCTAACGIVVSIYLLCYTLFYLFSIFLCFVIQFHVTAKVTLGFVMRNRSVSIIFGSLVLWAVATYFLFLDQQSVGKDQDKVNEKDMMLLEPIVKKCIIIIIYIFALRINCQIKLADWKNK